MTKAEKKTRQRVRNRSKAKTHKRPKRSKTSNRKRLPEMNSRPPENGQDLVTVNCR